MMRPDLGVVLEFGDLVDLIFCFDVPVLCNSNVHAHVFASHIGPVNARVFYGFIGTIHSNRSGPSSSAEIFFLLVSQFVEVTNASQNWPHVTGFVIDHTGLGDQQILAIFGQTVPIRCGQPDSGDDNSIQVRQRNTPTQAAKSKTLTLNRLPNSGHSRPKHHACTKSRWTVEQRTGMPGS